MFNHCKNNNGNKSFEFVPIQPKQANLLWCQATVIMAGLPALTLLALCFLLSDPEPSITTYYSGNFRFSFRFPCGFLPGGSFSWSVVPSILRFPTFPGTLTILRRTISIQNFTRLTPCSALHLEFHTQMNAQPLFPAGRTTCSRNSRFVCASAASSLPELPVTATPSDFLSRPPFGCRSVILLTVFLADLLGRGCIKSGELSIF